MVNNFID
ncbi:hypothetical protein ECEC1850_1984, partial [Escherichia coli EC1850]